MFLALMFFLLGSILSWDYTCNILRIFGPAGGFLSQDAVERMNPWNLTVGEAGRVVMMVPPMNAYLFVPVPIRPPPRSLEGLEAF